MILSFHTISYFISIYLDYLHVIDCMVYLHTHMSNVEEVEMAESWGALPFFLLNRLYFVPLPPIRMSGEGRLVSLPILPEVFGF